MKNLKTEELEAELEVLRLAKRKLNRQADHLDTEIVGVKEELRKRKEKS